MPEWITNLIIDQYSWGPWIRVGIYFLLAWLASVFSSYFAHLMLVIWKMGRQDQMTPERKEALQSLYASATSFFVFIVAILASLSLFIKPDTLVWMVGLFSAAFGLGARPLISDYLTGIGFIFADTFGVGEKVDILGIEGVIEKIDLRTTWMRAPNGELVIIPNGEIRLVSNYSRGKFSTANISLKVVAADLSRALVLLQRVGREAVSVLPNLLEPWQVISKEGVIGQQAELTLLTKARFGKAAEMRPRLLALVQERLAEAEIELVD
jgi:moderate conductance mechanosensitive channel